MTENVNTTKFPKRKVTRVTDTPSTKKFKPSSSDQRYRINIIQPKGGIPIEKMSDLENILKADVWEKNIKIGRFRLVDIRAKFR